MPDPVASLSALGAKYGPYVTGLAIGTLGKYGLTLHEGKRLTWRGLVGDLFMQGILGCIAIAISDALNLTGNAQVFVAALVALNSDRLVMLVRDTFFRRMEAAPALVLGNQIKAAPSTVAEVPAGHGEPAAVTVQPPVEDKAVARAGASLRRAYGEDRTPGDMKDLLGKLGDGI